MGRTKTTGIQKSDAGYDIDKVYKGERLRQRGFEDFEAAEAWLVGQMERINQSNVVGQRLARTFEEAATHYLEQAVAKKSLESEIFHLAAVMPYIGHLLLDQIYNDALVPFVDARKAEGRKCKTINHSLGMVRKILNLAARDWRDANGMTWLAQTPMITLLPLIDQRPPRPIMWDEQRRFLPLLPDHLAEMALFDLNTGVRDDVVCNLQWSWEIPVRQLGISVFVVPAAHVKGVVGKKTDMVLVCNSVAQSIVERQRGKHATHVFTYRRERVKNKDQPPVMPYRPIQTMNNTAWQNAREKAGLGDLHVHDLRHTVGLRLREAGISDRTQDAILWHSCKTMTAHYSMAQLVEVFEALEKIKDEANRWNISLTSLIHEANVERLTQKSPTQRQTG
jgi:integrase